MNTTRSPLFRLSFSENIVLLVAVICLLFFRGKPLSFSVQTQGLLIDQWREVQHVEWKESSYRFQGLLMADLDFVASFHFSITSNKSIAHIEFERTLGDVSIDERGKVTAALSPTDRSVLQGALMCYSVIQAFCISPIPASDQLDTHSFLVPPQGW